MSARRTWSDRSPTSDELSETGAASSSSRADKFRSLVVRKVLQDFRYNNKVSRTVEFLVRKHLSIEKTMRSPDFVRTQDKVLYTLGVMNICALAFLVGRYPWTIPYFYAGWSAFLIPFRFFAYHKTQSHWFLLDFCYLANMSLLFYLFLLPTSKALFTLCFAVSHGPLLFAIPTWNNKLVFFSLDFMTSVFIHAMPPLVTFLIRWRAAPEFAEWYTIQEGTFGLWECYRATLLLHIYWQVGYLVKTEVIESRRMSPEAVTSFRYLTGEGSKSVVGRILCRVPAGRARLVGFIVLQLLYSCLTIFPVTWMYTHFWVNVFALLAVLSVSIWNSAVFFVDTFSVKYVQRLEQLRTDLMRDSRKNLLETEQDRSPKDGGKRKTVRSGAISD
eukprot:ANDGO_06805.mRNA.1 putative membrane protein C776.05